MMLTNEIKFARMADDVILPSKREEDAGYDIYPHFNTDMMYFAPHETRMVPTGLISAFSSNYVVILKERGSTGTKGIGQRAGIIDSGFRREWFVPLTNHNDCPMIIIKATNKREMAELQENNILYPYEKAICQALVVRVPKMAVSEVSVEEIKSIGSERGDGMLGSSGK